MEWQGVIQDPDEMQDLSELQDLGELQGLDTSDPPPGFLEMLNTIINNENIILRTEIININQGTEENNNNNGCSEEFINNIEERVVTDEFLKRDKQCSICLEDFKLNDKYMVLPCSTGEENENHVFHSGNDDCSGVKEWLKRNNSCPLCREEFPKEIIEPGETIETGETMLDPNSLSNDITDIITNYINEIGQDNEQRDIQLAIEASLNDI
jgi:hypothetical protein